MRLEKEDGVVSGVRVRDLIKCAGKTVDQYVMEVERDSVGFTC